MRSGSRPDGGEFFERDGILLLGLDEVQHSTSDLMSAQPFLGTLAAEPTLRGVFRALSQSLEGVRLGKAKLEDLEPAFAALADAFELLAQGKTPPFSWRELIAGRPPKPSELRRFVNIEPVLDFGDLQPGGKATAVIREVTSTLGLTPERGGKVRLTGSAGRSARSFRAWTDRRNGHHHGGRDYITPASGLAHGAQTTRRAEADRLCRAGVSGSLSGKAAQLDRRNDAGRDYPRFAAARRFALRLQSAQPAGTGC